MCRARSLASILPLLAALPACRSVEWQAPPQDVPTTWRELTLHDGGRHFVLARDDGEAQSVYLQTVDIESTIRTEARAEPGRGLVIALSAEDAPLLPDAIGLGPKITEWYAATVGMVRARGDATRSTPLTAAEMKNSGLDTARVMKLLGGVVDRRDTTLGIPAELRDRVAWIAVVPTRPCIEATIDEVTNATLAIARPSFGESLLVAAFLPAARSRIADAVQAWSVWVCADACCRAAGVDPARTQVLAQRCVEDAGLSFDGSH